MPETPKSFEEWQANMLEKADFAAMGVTEYGHAVWNAALASLPPQAAAVPAKQDASPEKENVYPKTPWEDARVKIVYDILCDDVAPPIEEHQEGFDARRIVDALFPAPQTAVGEGELPAKAEAQLAAMTKDRNLWRDAHNEDCPNLAASAGFKEEELKKLHAIWWDEVRPFGDITDGELTLAAWKACAARLRSQESGQAGRAGENGDSVDSKT